MNLLMGQGLATTVIEPAFQNMLIGDHRPKHLEGLSWGRLHGIDYLHPDLRMDSIHREGNVGSVRWVVGEGSLSG